MRIMVKWKAFMLTGLFNPMRMAGLKSQLGFKNEPMTLPLIYDPNNKFVERMLGYGNVSERARCHPRRFRRILVRRSESPGLRA